MLGSVRFCVFGDGDMWQEKFEDILQDTLGKIV